MKGNKKMLLIEIKSATITEKGQISIPKGVRGLEGFQVGAKVAVLAYEDHIELRPLKQISESMATAFASEKSLGRDWNSKEDDKAWTDL